MKNKFVENHDLFARHSVKPIPFKAHKLKGLSAELMEGIYENRYGTAVRKLNELVRQQANLASSESSVSEYMTLTRSLLKTINAITLHEIYFNGLGDESEQREFIPAGKLGEFINASFGSVERMYEEFSTLSKFQTQATQWILLVWSDRIGQLLIVPFSDDEFLVSCLEPVLAINVQQYVFENDFDNDRDTYILAYLQCIHWGRVSSSFDTMCECRLPVTLESTAESITVNELKKLTLQVNDAPLVLDVRHADDCERYRHRIDNTRWCDSFDVSSWAGELPRNKPIIVYCMYGFWVSQDVATELRDQGFDARSLIGGVNSWRAMGYGAFEY